MWWSEHHCEDDMSVFLVLFILSVAATVDVPFGGVGFPVLFTV